MRIRSLASFSAGLAAAAIMLAGCTVVEDGPGHRPPPPRPGGSTACTFEYAPVCGERRGDRQTFPNACTARADGFRVIHAGQCRRGSGPDRDRDRARACTREYAPVCARQGRDVRTFGNACEARAADYRVVSRGRC